MTTLTYDSAAANNFSAIGITQFTLDGIVYTLDQPANSYAYNDANSPNGPTDITDGPTDGVLEVNADGASTMRNLTISLANGHVFSLQSFDLSSFNGDLYIQAHYANGSSSALVQLTTAQVGGFSGTVSNSNQLGTAFNDIVSFSLIDQNDPGSFQPSLDNLAYLGGNPPTTTVSTLILSADTGTSSTDFITQTAAQTISGTLSANLAPGEIVEVRLDSAGTWTTASASAGSNAFSISTTLLSGTHTLEARVTNSSGTGTPRTQSYTLDTTPPPAPVVATPANGSATNTPAPTVTGTAEANSRVAVLVDGAQAGTTTADGSGNFSLGLSTPLSDGAHTFRAQATDLAGNVSPDSATRTATIDTVAPDTTITTAPPSRTNASSVSFVFSGSDAGSGIASYQVSLDGASYVPAGSPTQIVGMADGSHIFRVRALDNAGNTDASPASYSWTIDTAAPTVTSINRANGAANPSNAASDAFTVTFSEDVTGVDATDFTAATSGTTSGSISVTPVSGSVYTVTVNGVGGNGTLGLDLKASGTGIADTAGNALSGTGFTGETYAVDQIAPTITGNLSTSTTGPSNAASLTYTLGFSEAVAGVDASDFVLRDGSGNAVAGAIVGTPVASNGNQTYTVTVSGLSAAEGAVHLDLKSTGTGIQDGAGNALADGGATGTSVTLDHLAPTVTSVAVPAGGTYRAGQALTFTVNLSEAVTVDTSGGTPYLAVTLDTGGSVQAAYTSGSGTSALTFSYTVASGNADSDGITVGALNLNGGTIRDAATNGAVTTLNSVAATSAVLVDGVAPPVTSIAAAVQTPTNATSAAFTVTFSEPVNGVDASDFTLAGTGTAAGNLANATVTPTSPSNGYASVWTVSVPGITGDGTLRLDLNNSGTGIADQAGNGIIGGFASGQTYTLDHTAPGTPTLTLATDSGSSASDGISQVGTVAVTGLEQSANWAYSTDGGTTWTPGTASSFTLGAGSYTAGRVRVRQTDAAGNTGSAASLSAVTIDATVPALASATVNGSSLVVTFADTTPLEGTGLPGPSTFAVTAGGSAVAVNAVAVDAAARTITLTLAAAVSSGQTVTLGYTDPNPNADDATGVLQDLAGNDAASFAGQAVTNTTAAPPPPPPPGPPTTTIDGVAVQTTTTTNADGSTSYVVTIPIITDTRVESVGGNSVADIPLVTSGGSNLLTAQVPTGFGLTASGPGTVKTAGSSLTDLIREIKAHTTAGSSDQTGLTSGGSDFIGSLPTDKPLLVQTIVPIVATGATTSPAAPLVITGQPASTGTPTTALVIDTRSLPSGSTIELQDVDFAALIGAASVTGGNGSQHVWGDSANQFIVLGADDDTLHGGGGNDYVGSHGGNDVLYGDAGDDTVSGGIGLDSLFGGTEQDLIYGNQDADLIYGNQGDDSLYGGQGDDRAFGGQGDDRIWGNAGADRLSGNIGADIVYGNQGNDVVYGNQGADILYGGQGNDVLYGGQGDDTLVGGVGDDILVGGLGVDLYRFDPNSGSDLIVGFDQAGGDRIALGGQTYTVSSAQNGDALLTLSGGGVVDLAGIRPQQVDASYFAA